MDLHRQLREAILEGRLSGGYRLPSSRELSRHLRIARNSVVTAYEMLVAEGYASANQGSGTFILPTARLRQNRRAQKIAKTPSALSEPQVKYDFSVGRPDIGLFPFQTWHRLNSRAMRIMAKRFAEFGDPAGLPELRHAIAAYTSLTRAVASTPDDIVVTSGAQQAFHMLAQTLVKPGKTVVALEDPCYPHIRKTFEAAGAKIVGVPVERDGICVDKIPQNASIISVTPSHQFPLGVVLSSEKRKALLAFARRQGAYIIEDDYDCEFRYDGRPLDALQTLGPDCVFYVGTFSKTLFPALRTGFVAVPPELHCRMVSTKRLIDNFGAPVPQRALADFILEGHLRRYIARVLRLYGARRTALIQGLADRFGDKADILLSSAGLHLSVRFETKAPWRHVLQTALQHGILLEHAAEYRFQCEPLDAYILAFGGITEAKIKSGLAALTPLILG